MANDLVANSADAVTEHLPCIYCGVPAAESGNEHVLQGALGTTWMLGIEVCSSCNTGELSRIDTAMLQFVRLYAYGNRAGTPRNKTWIQDGLTHFFSEHRQVWITVYAKSLGKVHGPPQFILLDDDRVMFWSHKTRDTMTPKSAVSECQAELQCLDDVSISTHMTRIATGQLPQVQPALVRSGKKKYLILAATEADVGRVRRVLESGELLRVGDGGEAYEVRGGGRSFAQHGVEWPYSRIVRAIAKVAVNFVAATLGHERALHSDLVPIRRMVIRGDRVAVFPSPFVPSVKVLFDSTDSARQAATTFGGFVSEPGHHVILLDTFSDAPHVIIGLYGEYFATVRLTPKASELFSREDGHIAKFNHATGKHEVRSIGGLLLPSRVRAPM